jgi:aminoacrylate peracid reductase
MFTPITPKNSSKPLAPYVHGTRTGNTIYVSGTCSMSSTGETLFHGDIRGQTREVIEQIVSVVEAAGGTIDDIAFNTIFLADYSNYAAMNEVYSEYFGANPPARYCVKSELVRPDFLVEIASIAHLGNQ